MSEWYSSEATHEPLLIDCDSSPNVVFLRRNVEEVTKEMEDGTTYTAWKYEECTVSHEAYQQIMVAEQTKARSDIDYIAIMTEVDLDE